MLSPRKLGDRATAPQPLPFKGLDAALLKKSLTADMSQGLQWIHRDIAQQDDALDAFPPGPAELIEAL